MLKKIIVLFGFLFLISAAVVFSVYKGVFDITKIQFAIDDPNNSYDKDSLLRSARTKLKSFKGQPIFLFSLKQAYQQLREDPRIKEIKLKRTFPNQIDINVVPKQVAASVMSFTYGLHSMTSDGSLLPVEFSKQDLDLPILRGSNAHKDKRVRLETIKLLEQIPDKGLFSKQNISEIRYDSKNGFLIYLNSHDSVVKMGSTEFKKKSSYIERAMSYLESQKMVGRVIDARYSKKVVVKLRNEP